MDNEQLQNVVDIVAFHKQKMSEKHVRTQMPKMTCSLLFSPS
jgi:hypothetical protein